MGIVQLALTPRLKAAPGLGIAPLLTDIELIRKMEFFEALETRVIKQIAEMCIVREFSAGEYIVRQGESGLGLYFITAGKAKVEIERNDTKVVVAELKEGDSLGEFSIIDEKARSANVICLEETRCLLLTRDSFGKVMKKHPEIAQQMLRTLVGRIRNVNERITASAPAASPAPAATAAPAAGAAPAPAEAPSLSQEDLFTRITGMLPPLPSMSDIPHPSEIFRLYANTKTKTREYLNEMIGTIYAMKAMMRFSMAVVGCPVRVSAQVPSPEVLTAEIHGVKLVLFPGDRDETLRIEAYGDGPLHATFYCPRRDGSVRVTRLRGPVARDRTYELQVCSGGELRWPSPARQALHWELERSELR